MQLLHTGRISVVGCQEIAAVYTALAHMPAESSTRCQQHYHICTQISMYTYVLSLCRITELEPAGSSSFLNGAALSRSTLLDVARENA